MSLLGSDLSHNLFNNVARRDSLSSFVCVSGVGGNLDSV